MEIKRYMQEYRKHDPKDFFEWASQEKTMEIRFLSDFQGKKFNNWLLLETLSELLGVEKRFNSLYIDSYAQLRQILLHKLYVLGIAYPLTRIYNIFMSVNPKRKVYVKSKNGLLFRSYYGGIAGTSHVQNILCDIEHKDKPEGSTPEVMLEECICGAKFLVEQLELKSYYINISGNGTHLWFNLEEPIELPEPTFTEYEDKVKYNLKEEPIYTHIKTYNRFVEQLNQIIQKYNPKLMVDEGAKDISRIARPTGSWNIKAGKTNRAVGTVAKLSLLYNNINHKYMAAKPIINKKARTVIKRAVLSNKHRYNYLNLRESPLYKLMTSKYLPSVLSRNHYLEQSFARLLRDNNIKLSEVQDIIREIDIVQRKGVQVDPDYLDNDEPFNPEMINSYCVACKIDLVYPLLEDVPEITDGYMNEAHYNSLDSYSWATVEKMSINDSNLKALNSYLELKMVIRNLIDKDIDRSTIFFTLKNRFREHWEYYHKNRIVQQIMNKTRRQEK